MKVAFLLLPVVAALPSYGALALCQSNIQLVNQFTAATPFTVNCPSYTAASGTAVQQYGIRALFSYNTVPDIETGVVPPGSVSVTMTPQGATGSLIPPLTLSLPVNGFNGSHPITVSMTSLTLAVAAVAGIPVNITVGGTGTLPDTAFLTLWLTTQDTAIGSSQINPILPTSGGAGTWNFTNGNSGLWYDPPLVDAYDYTGTGGTLFNSITLPTGFTAPFDVYNGSTFIGSFAGGSAVNFVALTGGAVSSFRVGNINPLADAGSPTAFPLQIFFSTPTGSFTQTGVAAVPEPSTSLALVALAAWGWRRCRRPGTINSIA